MNTIKKILSAAVLNAAEKNLINFFSEALTWPKVGASFCVGLYPTVITTKAEKSYNRLNSSWNSLSEIFFTGHVTIFCIHFPGMVGAVKKLIFSVGVNLKKEVKKTI